MLGRGLLESVPRFEFAVEDAALVFTDPRGALRPAQKQIWPQRKYNRLPVYLRFNAGTFGIGRQAEAHRLAEDDRVKFAYQITDHGMNHLGFNQESRSVGPIKGDHVHGPAAV